MIRQEHVVERRPSVCMFPDPTVICGGEVGLADDKVGLQNLIHCKKTTPGVASDKAGLTSSPLPRTQRIRTRRKPCDPARQAFFQTLTQSMQLLVCNKHSPILNNLLVLRDHSLVLLLHHA